MTTAKAASNEDTNSVLQVALGQAKDKLVQAEHAIHQGTDYAAAETERYVASHPWTTLAVAGSIGVLIGLLLGRR